PRSLDLHSFPTRRSSDLGLALRLMIMWAMPASAAITPTRTYTRIWVRMTRNPALWAASASPPIAYNERPNIVLLNIHPTSSVRRSEEHTSELQSRFDLVC